MTHKNVNPLAEELTRTRDELKLQAHLFKLDAKESWESLEDKWAQFMLDMDNAKDVVKKTSANVDTASKMLAEEIADGYKKLKKSLGLH